MFLCLINLINYGKVTYSEAIKKMTKKKWTKRKIFGHIIFKNTKKPL